MTESTIVTLQTVPPTFNLAAIEKAAIMRVIPLCGTAVSAADMLGISRHALKRRMEKHQIEAPDRWRIHSSRDPQPKRD